MKEFLKKRWPWILGGLAMVTGVLLWFLLFGEVAESGKAVLRVETPQKLSASQNEEFTLDVSISHLGEVRYPAMSSSISFDPSRLEFLGVEEGNVPVLSDGNSAGRQLPEWNCNVDNSNQTGLINVMYLDMTGGRNAFCQELLAEEDNVVLRLKFRLRGSVRAGEVLDLIVEDSVFAATDERESLAMTTGTLDVKNGRLVIGE